MFGRRRRDDARVDPAMETLATWFDEHLGDLDRLANAPDDRPPPGGRARWIRDRLESAFATPRTRAAFAFDTPLSRRLHAMLRDERRLQALAHGHDHVARSNEEIATMLAGRRHRLCATGRDAARRIAEETPLLAISSDPVVARRLSESPPARLDALPRDPAARRLWIGQALAAEAAAIGMGAMSPERMTHAAAHALFEPTSPAADRRLDLSAVSWSASADPMVAMAARAGTMSRGSDVTLARRFHAIPGGSTPPADPRLRATWTRRALEAEATRPIAGLTRGAAVRIDLVDHVMRATDGGAWCAGDLVVDGERLCRIEISPDGALDASSFSVGCSAPDLEAIDLYLCATGAPRGETTPDSLVATILDLVALRAALDGYRDAARAAVLFVVDAADGPELMRVLVPEGGDREGAWSHASTTHPDAVCLDMMPEEEAAAVWIAHAR